MTRQQLSRLMDGEWQDLNLSDCVRGICADDEMRDAWARYHLIRDVINQEPLRTDTTMVSRIRDALQNEPHYSNITSINTPSLAQKGASVATRRADNTGSAELLSDRPDRPTRVQDAHVSKPPTANVSWWRTGLAGMALAASVAAVTVIGMNVWRDQASGADHSLARAGQPGETGQRSTLIQPVAGVSVPQVDLASNTGAYWTSAQSTQRIPAGEDRLNMLFSYHIESSPTAALEGGLKYSPLVGYDEREETR